MIDRRTHRRLAVAWLVGMLPALVLGLNRAQAAPDEFRAIACSRFEWPQLNMDACKTYIDTVMRSLHDANFNAVIFQMRGQCDTLYPSPYEPWSPLVSSDGNTPTGWGDFDPMAYAINKAHENGLEFHAYLNAHVVWNSATAPNYSLSHPFWRHGNPSDAAHQDWLCYNSAGVAQGFDGEYVWLAPGVPDFQAYWRKQIMYVVEYYDGSDPVKRPRVDGVHFDRIRTNSTDWSHDPISEARRLGEGNPAALPFGDWTRNQITRMLCDLYAQINESHPHVKLSSAPLGMHSGARYPGTGYPMSDCGYGGYGYSCKYQDPQAWLAAGAQDFICPQIYWADLPWRTSNPHFSQILPDWLTHNGGRHVYPFGNVSATGDGLLSENSVTRTMVAQYGQGNAPGNVYWYYGGFFGLVPPTYTVNLGPVFTAAGAPYESRVNVPAMPWKDTPTDGIILGNVTDGVGPVVDVHVTRSGLNNYVALSSADGVYSFLLVPPGTYTLTFSKPGYITRVISGVTVAAGQVTRMNAFLTGPDVLSPVVTDVAVSVITETGATIAWKVDKAVDSEVSYGTAPGQYTAKIGITADKAGFAPLVNLSPGTTYYYVVNAFDGVTAPAPAQEHQFTTLAEKTITDIIIDNTDAGAVFTGTWSTGTSAGKYGKDYRFASPGTGQQTAVFTPSIAAAGSYEVYGWWVAGSNRTSAAQYLITHASGTATVSQNQKNNGGKWNLLGTYTFALGTTGNVTITDKFSSTTGSVVMADAVKFVYLGVATGPVAEAGRDWSVLGWPFSVSVGGIPTARGGTPPYTYAWSVTAPPGGVAQIGPPTEPNPTFTAETGGAFQVSVLVTDALGQQTADSANITVQSAVDLATPPAGAVTSITGKSSDDQLGGGNASMAFGDVNGDGYADVIIGSSAAGSKNGAVTIIYGSKQIAGQALIDLAKAPPTGVSLTTVTGAGGMFGAAVAAGDVNGDGYDDVIVGVPWAISGTYNPGEVYVLYGQAGLSSVAQISITAPPASVNVTHIIGDRDAFGSRTGWAVAAGDLNADGYADVIVGTPMGGPLDRSGAGIVYVLWGSAAMSSQAAIDLTSPPGTSGELRVYGRNAGEGLGMSVACGDVNGDGYDDLVAGSPAWESYGGRGPGAAYVVYGSATISNSTPASPGVIDLSPMSPSGAGATRIVAAPGSTLFGWSIAAGDVNGDGYADVIVGSPLADAVGGSDAGAAYVVYGAADLAAKTFDLRVLPPPGAYVTRILGASSADYLGWSVAAGDINGDGLDDLLLGAYSADPSSVSPLRTNAGKLYVQPGRVDLPNTTSITLAAGHSGAELLGAVAGDRLGSAVAASADMNFDGVPDCVVSAPQAGGGAGSAYAVYGSVAAPYATVLRHDRAGNAPARDFGPSVRCAVDYDDPGQTTAASSYTVVAMARDSKYANIAPQNQAANVLWYIATDRTGDWTATVTFRYLDSEMGGLNPAGLALYRADAVDGPFIRVDATIDAAHNRVTAVVNRMGIFMLRMPVQWTLTPTAERYFDVVQNGAYPTSAVMYTLASTSIPLRYFLTKDCDWVTVNKAAGPVPTGGTTEAVTAVLNSRVRSLEPGSHTCTLTFQDDAKPGLVQTARITVTVHPSGYAVQESGGLSASGRSGGPFSPGSFEFAVSNTGEAAIEYVATVSADSDWITLSSNAGGPVSPGGVDVLTASINAKASSLPPRPEPYVARVVFTASSGPSRVISKEISLLVTRPLCFMPPQDSDGDSDVDMADFLVLQACFNGPNRPWAGTEECTCFDSDKDLDVDLADFLVFQVCFNGPDQPANCGRQ